MPHQRAASDDADVPAALAPDARVAIRNVADAVRRARYVVVMTGAGMSVESGIPPFRGTDGLWTKFGEPGMNSYAEFTADPQRYWARQINSEIDSHILELRDRLQRAQPHAGHHALAGLVRDGWVQCVVTQNIDALDEAAGIDPDRLIEIHGNRKKLRCIDCGSITDLADFVPLFAPDPCDDCGGVVKFDAVMFGEPLVPSVHAAAREHFQRADCVLAIGTTASVMPASQLLWAAARRNDPQTPNAVLAEINPEPTKATSIADWVVRATAGAALTTLRNELAPAD